MSRYLRRTLKGHKTLLHHRKPKNSAQVSLTRTILVHWNHFFSSASKDGEDGNGLNLEKIDQFFQVWTRCIPKIAKNFVWVVSLLKLIWSFRFGLSGILLLVSVSTKSQFPVIYDLKNAKLPWQCPFKVRNVSEAVYRWLLSNHLVNTTKSVVCAQQWLYYPKVEPNTKKATDQIDKFD